MLKILIKYISQFSFLQVGYFSLALGIGLFIKYFYAIATNEQLRFILFPVHVLVELQTGHQGIFSLEQGYIFANLNTCIDKSCAGLNFLAIAFLMSSFTIIKKIKQKEYFPFIIPILLVISFFVAIFANTSRILIALLSLRFLPTFARQPWFHEAQGAFVFVSTLVLFYLFIIYLTKKRLAQ
jgi:exosortase K